MTYLEATGIVIGIFILILIASAIRKQFLTEQQISLGNEYIDVDVTLNRGTQSVDVAVDGQTIPLGASPFGLLGNRAEFPLVKTRDRQVRLIITKPFFFERWRAWSLKLYHGDELIDSGHL